MIGLRHGKQIRACAGVAAAAVAICPARSISAEPTPEVALEPLQTSLPGDRFFLAPDATIPRAGAFSAKLFESYAYRPLLEVATPSGTEEIVSSELYFDVGASYSLLGKALFAVDLPIVPFQGGDTVEQASIGDLRLAARVRFAGTRHADFGTETRVFLPTGSPEALTSDGALRASQLLTVSGRFSSFVYAASVGYLARKRIDLYDSEVGPALPFYAAAGVDVARRLLIGAEIQGYTVIGGSNPFDERNTPVLGLLGMRFRSGGLVVGAGAGPGLSHAPGSAPHVVFTMAWEPPPKGRGATVETSVPPEPTIPLAISLSPPLLTPAPSSPPLPPTPTPSPPSASAPAPPPTPPPKPPASPPVSSSSRASPRTTPATTKKQPTTSRRPTT